MDVVLYMRYSSDRQTEQSIEGQRRVCRDFCRQQGYNIVKEYIDRATTATKDVEKRVNFNAMIKDSDKQLWQAVVVYKLDRFARNRYDSATFKARLKKNGVRVISATENISDNPEGIILEAVLEGMAEFYSKELAQKITRGMYESANKGYNIGGHIPLGYKLENKKLVVDPAGAKIVQEAFELYAAGKTVTEICDLFNKKGYRTAKGAEFNKNSFSAMFHNEKYIGVFRYKDIYRENGVPAIISKELFDLVANRSRKVEKAPSTSKAKVDYLLSLKIFCGHCGSLMVGDCGKSHTGAMHYYYTCGKKKRNRSCDKRSLQKDFIEKAVVEDAIKILTPENIELLADMAMSENQNDIENSTLIPVLQAELHEIEHGIVNLVKMAEKGVQSDTLYARLNELEQQKKDVERRLVEAHDDIIILEKEHIVWWLSKFLEGDPNDEEYRKRVIDLLVNSVTVWDESGGWYKITTTYNLIENNTQTFRVSSQGKGSDLSGQLPPEKKRRRRKSSSLLFYETEGIRRGAGMNDSPVGCQNRD